MLKKVIKGLSLWKDGTKKEEFICYEEDLKTNRTKFKIGIKDIKNFIRLEEEVLEYEHDNTKPKTKELKDFKFIPLGAKRK